MSTTTKVTVEVLNAGGTQVAQLTSEDAALVDGVMTAIETAVAAMTDPGAIAAHQQHLKAVQAARA